MCNQILHLKRRRSKKTIDRGIHIGEIPIRRKYGQQKTAMLGIVLEGIGKHAVVYTGKESGKFVSLNNKWENDESPN